MTTILRKHGLRFFIPKNDHEPKHVHVCKGDSELAKIEIESLRVVYSFLKKNELRKALTVMKENQEEFIRRWDEIVTRNEG